MRKDIDILREHFEYLISHNATCSGMACAECEVLAHIAEVLLERFEKENRRNWWPKMFHRVAGI